METATIELARVILLGVGLLMGMTFVIGCDMQTGRKRDGGADAERRRDP